MRHLKIALCALFSICAYAPLAGAGTNPPLAFTFDLLGPCTSSSCSGIHPTDINLNLTASTFSYAAGTGTASGSFVANTNVSSPVVCDEIASGGALGASTGLRIAPIYTNASPGGLLEFNAGGASIVDTAAMIYDGVSPAGISAAYSNYGAPLPPQIVCYQINPISGGPISVAHGPSAIFESGFDKTPDTHFADEPWVSVQSVFSPHASKSGTVQGVTLPNSMGYVAQIHNAAHAIGWRLDLGYDFAFFDPSNNVQAPLWCILDSSVPQPGPINGAPATCGTNSTSHTFTLADIQAGSNSIYVYIENHGTDAAVSNWNSLSSSFFPSLAAIFPPFGTYPERFDDKSAVASSNNLPTLNVGSVVCNDDKISIACAISDQDGQPVIAPLTFINAITGSGVATIDPLVYFVDPTNNTTLPGNGATDALTASNVSCDDPNQILASPIGVGSFTTSIGTPLGGALALGLSFAPSGGLYVPGTATCTATFTASGYVPALSITKTFTITMQQPNVTHFLVTAPATATAGTAFNTLVVTALDGANNLVGSYNGTVHFTSTDGNALLPANATLTGGLGTFSATLKTSGNKTITATDTTTSSITGTSNVISVSAAAATHFTVNAPSSAVIGMLFSISVTALDQFGNTASGYAGLVHFTSSDNIALLPVDQILVFGVGTSGVTLNTAGNQTITATDTVNASITGTSAPISTN